MSVVNFIPTIWAGSILRELEKELVFGSCVNRDYESLIKGQGDSIKINGIGPVTTSTYSGTVTYQSLDDASQYLMLDQKKYFAFKLADADAAQANAALLKGAAQEAAYSVKDTIDQFIANFYEYAGITSGLGTDDTPIEINSANVGPYLIKMARLLDDNNVPRAGRFCVIPPFFLEDLVIAKIADATDNTEPLVNGIVGRYAGFELKLSNNVVNTAGTTYKIMAGTNQAITYAQQIDITEAIRLESEFSDGVRGLYIYGAKCQRPEALACLTANEAAEA